MNDDDYAALFKASEDTIFDYLRKVMPGETPTTALKMLVVQSTLLLAREMRVPPSAAVQGLRDVMAKVEEQWPQGGPNR